MDATKTEHDVWMEKIENAVRSFRNGSLGKASHGGTEAPQRGTPPRQPRDET